MPDLTGWLLDLYEEESGGLALWLIGDDGGRHRLRQDFPITFYAAGPNAQLKALWAWLKRHPLNPHLSRDQRRDILQDGLITVLQIEVENAFRQPQLFQEMARQFPELDYYDADLGITLRHAARFGTFPLARCYVRADESGLVSELRVLDSAWDLDPSRAPLRVLSLRPDQDPAHAEPRGLIAAHEGREYHFSLESERALLINLRALLTRLDPDLLLTAYGDTWLLPRLMELGARHDLLLPLSRDPQRGVMHKKEGSYFSYGQIIYRGQQILLYGRCHIDGRNAMMWQDYDLDGALENARITALPIQTAARVSPGTGISSMQITTALRNDILVPWRKQAAERPKTAAELIRYDQGGLVYQPITGLHFDVGMIDFISMYPSIMVRSNISPETPFPDRLGSSDYPPGLIPLTLGPLLEKRVALKQRALSLPDWDPRRRLDKARSAAHKWLLVTCFGYLGYKNARFGRIEAHEAVTTWGREALLRAKEAAEEMGFEVLHMYVDGLWVKQDGHTRPEDFQPLLEEVAARTSLPVALDGVYRWVAFLPSRLDARLPVPNRYFGVFQDGSVKARGIDLRRRDSAPFVADVQREMLRCLAHAKDPQELHGQVDEAVKILRRHLNALKEGRIALEGLIVGKKLSKELEGYRVPSPGARATMQLLEAGKTVRPGQRVRLVFTRGDPGVHAWDLPELPDAAEVDVEYYTELLLRAAFSLLQPFGLSEEDLRIITRNDLGEQLDLPMHVWRREHEIEFFKASLPDVV
jgi:DNA polymerase-2